MRACLLHIVHMLEIEKHAKRFHNNTLFVLICNFFIMEHSNNRLPSVCGELFGLMATKGL
jgi:hypothetical protein